MTTYYANYNANNGTCFREPIEGTNLKRIIKDIREIAEGNRFVHNECKWSVWVKDESRPYGVRYLAMGGVRSNGQRYRVQLSELIHM